MSDNRADIEHLAELARLELNDEERTLLAGQLERVLEYVQQLQDVDVTGVPPTKHVLERTDVMRDDEPRDSLSREVALAAAPESEDDQFVVPGVLPR